MPPILFLDIDGPLTTQRTCFAYRDIGWTIFDPVAVAALNRIHSQTPFQIVMVSTKIILHYPTAETMVAYLKENGVQSPLHPDWRIPTHPAYRGQGVHAWLLANPTVHTWAILDDSMQDYEPYPAQMARLVHTSQEGMSFDNMRHLAALMSGQSA